MPDKDGINEKELEYDRNGFVNRQEFMNMGLASNLSTNNNNFDK